MLLRDTIRLRILFSDSGFMDSVIFRHRVSVQPRFNDYDIMGHINNTLFFSFFDIGKVAYFERVWGGFMNWRSMGLVVAHAEADLDGYGRDRTQESGSCAADCESGYGAG